MNTKVDEGKLISGKEALIALLQGKKVELLCDIGWDEITNLKDWDIKEFTENYPKYEFRLASSAIVDEVKLQWISVKDELPPTDTTVLICWSDAPDIEPEKDFMDICTDTGCPFWANYLNDMPTHWMPLPAAPAQGESHE